MPTVVHHGYVHIYRTPSSTPSWCHMGPMWYYHFPYMGFIFIMRYWQFIDVSFFLLLYNSSDGSFIMEIQTLGYEQRRKKEEVCLQCHITSRLNKRNNTRSPCTLKPNSWLAWRKRFGSSIFSREKSANHDSRRGYAWMISLPLCGHAVILSRVAWRKDKRSQGPKSAVESNFLS